MTKSELISLIEWADTQGYPKMEEVRRDYYMLLSHPCSYEEVQTLRARIARLEAERSRFDCRFAGSLAETSGSHCPIDDPCDRCRHEREVAALRADLAAAESRADALGAKIGKAPEGSHPDEQEPRGATWHEERQNWQSEVDRLTKEVQRVTRNWEATQERCEILADDAVAQQNRADALGARVEALEEAHRHIVGICDLCPDSRWALAIANQSNLALSSAPTAPQTRGEDGA